MRLTTRSRFALTAMTDVAMRCPSGPVTLSSISARHGSSLSYQEALFSALRNAGLIVSARGPGGGYSLARSAQDITVADITLASEQWKTGKTTAQNRDAMSPDQGAMTHALWLAFNQTVVEHLRGVSLADLVNQHQAVPGLPQEQPPAPTTSRRRAVPPKKQMPQDGVPNSVFALGTLARSR